MGGSIGASLRRLHSSEQLLQHLSASPSLALTRLQQQIQAQLVTNHLLHSDPRLLCRFASHYHAAGRSLPRTSLLLRHLLCRGGAAAAASETDPSPWNLLIAASAESDAGDRFLVFYRAMVHEGVPPDRGTFTLLLKHCVALPDALRVGGALHSRILACGLASDRFLLTGLLNFYSKCGCLLSAEKIFDEMPERDVIAHNAMISALSNHGRVDDARRMFERMGDRSSASWNSMITCYCKANDLDSAREIFDRNPVKDIVSWNAMIDGYCKMGRLAMARELFDRLGSSRNSVTWNTMISGYLHHRDFSTAVSMFRMMQVQNVKPTGVTMVSLLTACSHLGALDMGRWIHAYIRNHHLKVDVILGNAIMDMYFKCGDVEDALETFYWMPMRNIFCWNTLIAGLGMNGHGNKAIEMFIEMERFEKIKPDAVTFVGLLSACSHSGLLSEGKKYFSQMMELYGIEPMIEHYGCMVDLLGRAGLLKEALHLLDTMRIQPNVVVYGSLLRACRTHKDAKLSEQVTKRLLELDPSDGANYVFLSNMYASSRRWDDVERCRSIMVEKGVHKLPGCSSIEINNEIHEFVVGDTSHQEFANIYAFLVEIDKELRKLGYQPSIDSVLHDIEDEEKENATMYHSERIAIAFGFMSTKGSLEPIRVVKNLRVCSDCHEATKLMAKLFNRVIIVRDRNRFHHFREGTCSCNDYW